MKREFKSMRFGSDRLDLIKTIDEISKEYETRMTVRQLYYQLVARGIIENTERSYKRTTVLVNDAKLAGYLDWDAIEDRTREFDTPYRVASLPAQLEAVSNFFHMDMWRDQPSRVFVIVEKEALAGVLEPVCRRYDVPLLAARGYPSGTVLYEFVTRVVQAALFAEQKVVILHLGDHDPSGLDMSRDLVERIALFLECGPEAFSSGDVDLEFRRLALNRDQVDRYKPPPNPAKSTDSRFVEYRREHGSESWELDALRPDVLSALVSENVEEFIVPRHWEARTAEIEKCKQRLRVIAKREAV